MRGGKLRRRVFSIRLPPEARRNLESFLERVMEELKAYGSTVRLEGDSLRVEIYGQEYMIREAWARLKRLISEYWGGPEGGYPLSRVNRDVGLALPGDVVAFVLKAEGARAEYREGRIITDQPYEVVVEAGVRVRRALEEARALYATRTAKKAVVAASALTTASVEEVVGAGLEAGILLEDDEGKITIKGPWEDAARELARVVEEWRTGRSRLL